MSDTTDDHDQESCPVTPVLAQHYRDPSLEAAPDSSVLDLVNPNAPISLEGDAPITAEMPPTHLLLPIPTPSMNRSQPSVAFSHAILAADNDLYDWGSLPPEIASADISIAPDGSFVETSSGPAAIELKRRYDQYLGVGKDVRSPYAITSFVNQHGKQMHRVGHRGALAPAAAAAEAEQKAQKSSATNDSLQSRSKRKLRMSVHTLLSQSRPKTAATHMHQPAPSHDAHAAPRSKLRKPRSIPDMFGSTTTLNTGNRLPGRTHSQSVTGADMPRLPPPVADMPKPPTGDIFADVMQWHIGSVPQSPFTSSSVSESESGQLGFITHPFGPGVAFDSPTRRPAIECLPMPRGVRPMQSFESGVTARAGDTIRRTDTPDSVFAADRDIAEFSPSPPPRLAVSPFTKDTEFLSEPPDLAPLPETSMHSRYSTEVFDVLQTYRGLPLLDRLFPDSGETTIKMSLRSDESAAPRDDPRFVLWGETQTEVDGDDLSLSQGSRTGMSSPVQSRRSTRGGMSEIPSVRVSKSGNEEEGTHKVLIAATIERWIAQLTSELNYDELLNFFLTYRTYISAVDLCHLLICRFHWSLSRHATKHDEMVRRIVRVRTFVAIRYWLLTFFIMDFLPNRELRLLLASWLNALVRDPILKKHQDGLSIVRKLIKVVKDCKEAHTRRRRGSVSARQSMSLASKPRPTHLLGDKFAEAISKQDEDSDVDLDFIPDEATAQPKSIFHGGDSSNTFSFGSTISSPPRPTAVASASVAILQQPLQMNILQQSRASASISSTADVQSAQGPMAITLQHSALSRAFVKTIGRLGRWKRVLNSRSTVQTALAVPANVSAFDLELSATGDLLTVRGGVEQYLKMIEPSSPATPVHPKETHNVAAPSAADSAKGLWTENTTVESTSTTSETKAEHSSHLRAVTEEDETSEAASVYEPSTPKSPAPRRSVSLRSHSTDSFGSILSSRSRINPLVAQVQAQPPWQFDVVSIDDLDLSDASSEANVEALPAPPGLRKVPRRLPLRRDFEFVRRSVESVSSMGIRSRDSVASASSRASSISASGGLGTNIQQWQMNALVDSLSDDDEAGGVEEALLRLEGQIHPSRRKEKAQKVDGWVRTIQERMAAGDFGDEHPRFFTDSDEEDDQEFDIDQHETGSYQSFQAEESSFSGMSSQLAVSGGAEDYFNSTTTSGSSTAPPASPSLTADLGSLGPASPLRTSDAKPAPEDAVPLEILQSRVPSRPSTSHGPPSGPSQASSVTSPSKFVGPASRRPHRCWILSVSAEALVQHFSMIDRELFLGVKPEELILDDWMSCQEVNVLDWVQYLKDRARWKAESRWNQKTSALAAVRARFNLISNFVVSEMILTHPSDRAVLMGKFIRVAFKAYFLSNFNTLVAILAGIRNEWVVKAMKRHWNRVGETENQLLHKLTQFTTAVDDFKALHEAVTAMVDAKPMNVGSHASSIISNGATDQSSRSRTTIESKTPSACVPFVGTYLSQLYRYSKLPDLIDPTAPHEPVGVDPQTVNFDSPAHPDVFDSLTPLPPSMQLEPLINVHKQRLIASVIKDLVAGQHLASRVQYPVDKKLFQKCLKLRGLDSETLQRAYMMYAEPDSGPSRSVGFIPL
ncbi:ras GEF [Leucogyrophana mollusca]|uniref:Ras GEF n=1 Tax=Leucogyrophana mollusca TaxID=85980 RepID=A0ACB8BSJ1_9AGAM|nr:ras GEF [Leucogyrophana mollusca]